MAVQIAPLPVMRFYDNNNNPLAGGQLFTYQAGTSTPAATYTDSTASTANLNPVILNARGEASVWLLATQAYKFILKDASGNTIWSVDNITSQNPVAVGNMTDEAGLGGTPGFAAGVDFTAGTTTSLTLSQYYGSAANLWVAFDASEQGADSYSLSGKTLTFNAPIPVGVNKVYVKGGSSLSVGTPSDGTVTDSKVASGSKLYNRITYLIDARDKGATGNGSTDDRTALAAADVTGNPWYLSAGTYRIGSNLTLNGHVTFLPGAVLKPDAGVTVTFAQNFTASPGGPQIFDLSNSGALISLPYNITEVWAEWWGANGNLVKTDNQIPIQQALNAVAATATGGSGVSYGHVRLGRGWFLVSDQINIPNYTKLIGSTAAYTVIQANPATWSGSQYMFVGTNSGKPMFDTGLWDMRISAHQITAINKVVYTDSWQEKSGLKNVLMRDFLNYGFFYEIGYGGAAQLFIEDCELVADATATAATSLFITNTSSQGWLNLSLRRTDLMSAAAAANNNIGCRADNRVMIVCDCVQFAVVSNGFLLSTYASVCGNGVNGEIPTTALFNMASGWTGTISVKGVMQAGATNIIVDSNRSGYAFAALAPLDGEVIWPPSANTALASASVNGGATPAFVYQNGKYATSPFASVTHSSTGVYLVTMASWLNDLANCDVIVSSQDSNTPIINYSNNTTTSFNIVTRNNSGVVTDSAGFALKLYHKN